MPLPDQKQETYTADEVQHLVAREVMKHRIGDIETKLSQHESSTSEAFSEIKVTLKNIERQLGKNREDMHSDINECRRDFRAEVEKDFATKIELQNVEAKVDKLAAKIVTATAIVMFAIQLLFQFFS